jgi:preprotein translocase subunit YajC
VQDYAWLLWLLAIVAVFYLLIIRPQQQRQKAAAKLQSELSIGDEVMLTSGIFGTVTGIGDDHLKVAVAPGTEVKVAKGAVGAVVPGQETSGEDAPDEER